MLNEEKITIEFKKKYSYSNFKDIKNHLVLFFFRIFWLSLVGILCNFG